MFNNPGMESDTTVTNSGLSRRNALAGVATVGVALPLLAACSADSSDTASDPTPSGSGSSGSGADLGAAADIPVGGGVVFADQKVVVTQPTKGDFKGFTAMCTHQGCAVSSVADGTINCPCHGSKFSIEDGSVEAGPAPSALGAVDLTVKGGEISLA
jgi:nitrite reductase/ring-hydroxylating ferredoxin subunit